MCEALFMIRNIGTTSKVIQYLGNYAQGHRLSIYTGMSTITYAKAKCNKIGSHEHSELNTTLIYVRNFVCPKFP